MSSNLVKFGVRDDDVDDDSDVETHLLSNWQLILPIYSGWANSCVEVDPAI